MPDRGTKKVVYDVVPGGTRSRQASLEQTACQAAAVAAAAAGPLNLMATAAAQSDHRAAASPSPFAAAAPAFLHPPLSTHSTDKRLA